MKGKIESKSIKEFANEQSDNNIEPGTIDPSKIKQIIMLDLDIVKTMNFNKNDSSSIDRLTIVNQYLTIFTRLVYNLYSPVVLGLVSFNHTNKFEYKLNHNFEDLDKNIQENLKEGSTKRLIDSLVYSCDEIVKFRKNEIGKNLYVNSKSQILVFSDGEFDNSVCKVEDVVNELIKNKIIVNCIIINDNNKNDYVEKMMSVICHATGGYCFKPKKIEEGFSIIEKSALLNCCEMKPYNQPLIKGDRFTIPSRLQRLKVTDDLMRRAAENSNFDDDIMNTYLIRYNFSYDKRRLTTIRRIVALNADNVIRNTRRRRILREMSLAIGLDDPKSTNFDPDIKIFPFRAIFDVWEVLIKSPEDSIYGKKWWLLIVFFS